MKKYELIHVPADGWTLIRIEDGKPDFPVALFETEKDAEFAKRCFEEREVSKDETRSMADKILAHLNARIDLGAAVPHPAYETAHEVHEDDGEIDIDTPLYIEPKEGEK